MLPNPEVESPSSMAIEPIANNEMTEQTPIRTVPRAPLTLFHPPRSTPFQPPQNTSKNLKMTLSFVAGAATTLPIYLPLSWQAGQGINTNLGLNTSPATLPIPAAIAFCSAAANLALSTDKFNATIERLPELTRLLSGAVKTCGGLGHLLANISFVLASSAGAISLTNITYELYKERLLRFALIPAGLIALGRIMIGTTALVDLKHSMLWWVNVLRDPAFKANQELISLLDDIQPLITHCTSAELTALQEALKDCPSEEDTLSCLLDFAKHKDVSLTSFTLFNKGLWIRLAIFILIGIPASIIYYSKAATGIATALNLSPQHWRTILAAGLSVLPILTLQGMASQRTIYQIGSYLGKELQQQLDPENVKKALQNLGSFLSDIPAWLKTHFSCLSLYHAVSAPLRFMFSLKTVSAIIGIGSSASAIQIAVTAAGGSIPLLLCYIPPAATAAALTNILSMQTLIDKLTTQTTPQQEEVLAEINELKRYLTELFINDRTEKIIALREHADSDEIAQTDDYVINIPIGYATNKDPTPINEAGSLLYSYPTGEKYQTGDEFMPINNDIAINIASEQHETDNHTVISVESDPALEEATSTSSFTTSSVRYGSSLWDHHHSELYASINDSQEAIEEPNTSRCTIC